MNFCWLTYLEYSGSTATPKSGNENSTYRSANFYHNEWANKFPHLTEVNKYKNNPSSFGTLNQSGNAMEWTETSIGNHKMVLGGSLFLPLDTIRNDYWDSENAHKKISSFGFRVGKIINQNEEKNNFKGNTYTQQKNTSAAKKSTQENLDEWKKIDHAGNISDYKTGRGCVPYEFEIQAGEITNHQYAEFLNSVANLHDKYKLFNKDMSDGVVGGIDRFNKGSEYIYLPKEGYESRPATYLSWSSLARYANWLHFGKPKGEQTIGVTEGTDSIGSYDTIEIENFLTRSPVSVKRNYLKRNKDAKYFIPNDDEWYKAAYFDPSRNSLNKYWNYPNQSNSKPSNSKDNSNSINYQNESLGEGNPFFVNIAGEFGGSSYFKILDMGGNAWEWIEDWYTLGNENCWRCNTPKKRTSRWIFQL